MDSDLRFTKIKFDGAKVRLEYERLRKSGDPDEFVLYSADAPTPEFQAVIQALAVDVVSICELIPSDTERMQVRGVTLSHTNDVMGVVITALKSVSMANSPLVLNTPHLPETSYSDDDSAPTWPTGMGERIAALEVQASLYLNGTRAQGDLFEDNADKAEMHDAAARLGEIGGTLITPDGERMEFNEDTAQQNRAKARDLRQQAGKV